MRGKAAILLCTTALTPVGTPAQAGPIIPFFSGLIASIGATATTAAVAQALGGAALLGFKAGTFLFGTFLGQLILSVGLSAIAQALQPRPNIPSPSDRMVNFAQPISPMEWAFGLVRKGGPYALTSFQGDRRHYAVLLCAHSIDGLEQWYLDQRPVETVENGDVLTDPYGSALNLRLRRGQSGQVADSILVNAIPEWTTNHDMAGLAYVAAFAKRVKDKDFADVYGNSPATGPTIAPAFRAADTVYDPRTDSYGWSNNAVLIFAWIVQNVLRGEVDWNEIAEEADIADQLVQNRAGGLQRKWTLNGVFDDRTEVAEILKQVIAGCDAYVYERPDGTLGFKVGRYIEPTITLTEHDFYSLQVSERSWGPQPPTEWVARYVEPDYDWNEAVTGVWVEDEDAREVRRDPALYLIDSHNQAVRAIKRIARVERAQYSVQGELTAIGYELLGGASGRAHRFVRVQTYGFDFVMEIGRISRGEQLGVLRIEGTSVRPEDFQFNAATEEPERPPRQKVKNDNTVAPPDGLAAEALDGGSIRWSWNAQPDNLTQALRFRQVGAGEWQPAIAIGEGETSITTIGHTDGEFYEAQLRNLTAASRPSVWVGPVSVQAVVNSTPPEALQEFEVTAIGSDVAISFQTPNDPNYAATRIYRADYATAYSGPYDIADASLIATIYGPPNASQGADNTGLADGNYAFWAAPINASGIEGPLSGPETFDILA
ncbi:MAG: hypothetical protein ACK4NO_01950 [Glycocaulis sp.]